MTLVEQFEDRLEKYISNHELFDKSQSLLVAFSGGVDSTVLLFALNKRGYKVAAAHCNFKLREEESDSDEKFCRAFCRKHNIPFHSIQFNTKEIHSESGESIQQTARKLRYRWFETLSSEYGYQRIPTAHHQDDDVETILINLVRGTGLSGLAGIPLQRGKIVRPFKGFTKEEIKKYALESELSWVEDASNLDDKYLRNALRHNLIPVLAQINPAFKSTISRTGKHLTEANYILQSYLATQKELLAEELDNGGIRIKLKSLRQAQAPISILHYILSPFGFSESQFEDILLAESGSKFYSDSHEIWISKSKGGLLNTRDQSDIVHAIWDLSKKRDTIELGKTRLKYKTIPLSEWSNDPRIGSFDFEKINGPLTIRNFLPGDWMCPLGMGGKRQKLQDIFVNAKFSPTEKRSQLVLTDSENQIIWLPGLKVDERFKVDDGTEWVLIVDVLPC